MVWKPQATALNGAQDEPDTWCWNWVAAVSHHLREMLSCAFKSIFLWPLLCFSYYTIKPDTVWSVVRILKHWGLVWFFWLLKENWSEVRQSKENTVALTAQSTDSKAAALTSCISGHVIQPCESYCTIVGKGVKMSTWAITSDSESESVVKWNDQHV